MCIWLVCRAGVKAKNYAYPEGKDLETYEDALKEAVRLRKKISQLEELMPESGQKETATEQAAFDKTLLQGDDIPIEHALMYGRDYADKRVRQIYSSDSDGKVSRLELLEAMSKYFVMDLPWRERAEVSFCFPCTRFAPPVVTYNPAGNCQKPRSKKCANVIAVTICRVYKSCT